MKAFRVVHYFVTGLLLTLGIQASHTPDPVNVTIAGSLQSELGCPGDWDPSCPGTHLAPGSDAVWRGTFIVPAGSWEYKAALNNSWDENYGAGAMRDGGNISLSLAAQNAVTFYYDHKTHWITDNFNSRIVTAVGDFQSELGCSGDWDPGCLRTWLQDPDGDNLYTFSSTDLPAGNYQFKIAINESWAENYGAGGAPNGANIPFTVPGNGYRVTFKFDSASNVPTVTVESTSPSPNNQVERPGLRHNSRDTLYRTPGGAVPSGTSVTLRFRTFHNDVTQVALRVFDINANQQKIIPMTLAAADCGCYEAGLESARCDFWEAQVQENTPNNLWYRFIVTDGTDTAYYADNTPALDGGLGSPSDQPVDYSYALMFYHPAFSAPAWARNASIYQIFPDRFRDGRANNNPATGDLRYEDPVLKLPWGTLPEGYCEGYADGDCPWRFDLTPPDWSPLKEVSTGRDYYGGDLKGVDQQLDYLQALGVDTLYFNPIFDAASNHGYDTQDYYKIDPYFGTQKDWENLVKHANQRGMRIILDGVFNHVSSDSQYFDRYGRYGTVGGCEALNTPYRDWFYFHDVAAGLGYCFGAGGPDSTTYDAWFGFDSLPVINKSLPAVQSYFLTGANSVSKYWLRQGAAGWRLDVMGDASFPNGYWETFRNAVKSTKTDALIISETWQKDSALLRMLRGDRADTTMNYRLRDAVIGLLAPQNFDSKGFPDSGRVILPSEFAARLESIREDYPDAAYYSLMNLLDSHDTERVRWTLTPGAETTASKEIAAANVAEGKLRQKIASLIQYTVPGAPTVYYGDEVGVTGDDDPDNRRTYPWADLGGSPDAAMLAHYKALNTVRRANPALINGDFKMLAVDDTAQVVAYGRKTTSRTALVVVNRANSPFAGLLSVAGYLHDGISLNQAYVVGNSSAPSATVSQGSVGVSLGALSAVLYVSDNIDLLPPAAPANLRVTGEGNSQITLEWNSVPGAAGYNVYRSPVHAGGYEKVNATALPGTTFTDIGLQNTRNYNYVVTALDAAGNESAYSNEVSAMPHLVIGWANVQWPPTLNHVISVVNRTDNVYGQVWIAGATSQPGAAEGLVAQLGFGPAGTDPRGQNWNWVDASFNTDAGNNDEFVASLLPESTGSFDYVYRYSTTGRRDWLYADLNGPVAGQFPTNPGKLTVPSSGDTTPPVAPSGLRVTSASPAEIALAWDSIAGDPTLYGYEVLRSRTSGGPYEMLARVTGSSYSDTAIEKGATYYYVVRGVDHSFNRSGNSAEVSAVADLRTVTVTFNVTVPASTDSTGRLVYITGSLQPFGLPDWDPGAVALTRVDATHWTITLAGPEGTSIEYKYTLGTWDFVEKGGACEELPNRQLTLTYGANGAQQVNDTVLNWRGVAPCGN